MLIVGAMMPPHLSKMSATPVRPSAYLKLQQERKQQRLEISTSRHSIGSRGYLGVHSQSASFHPFDAIFLTVVPMTAEAEVSIV